MQMIRKSYEHLRRANRAREAKENQKIRLQADQTRIKCSSVWSFGKNMT